MGNPAIQRFDAPPLPIPERIALRWRVYNLRDYMGRKLKLQETLRMEKVGSLTIDWHASGLMRASLQPAGQGVPPYEIAVHRWRLTDTGLMLYGTYRTNYLHEMVLVPQTWWCVPVAKG